MRNVAYGAESLAYLLKLLQNSRSIVGKSVPQIKATTSQKVHQAMQQT